MSKIKFKAIPTFRILDLEIAKDFYVQLLGFIIDWEHRFGPDEPVYMQISKDGLVLHLTENERFQTKTIIFVEAHSLNQFYSELSNKESSYSIPEVTATNWNTKQLEIEDPFGNLLRFNENPTE
ncbi:VOC family protein [bacterium AH-315-C07]|nr:VOC family protein [bacterium AH-315-C07]